MPSDIATETTAAPAGVEPAVVAPDPADIRIVVLPRGWVLVGHYAEAGDRALLTKAAVVRRWGTSKGLGELAAHAGPLRQTALDPCPPVEALLSAVVLTMRCSPGWAEALT